MSTRVLNRTKSLKSKNSSYSSEVINNRVPDSISDGALYQQKPVTVREMVTRKINKTLCCCLLFTILVTFISYYIAMNYEAKLNKLDSEIVRINSENLDLQADLDRYKSFNNVDDRVGKFNLLQKANKVIEVTAMNNDEAIITSNKPISNEFRWAIGY